jgi:hypothetical protein
VEIQQRASHCRSKQWRGPYEQALGELGSTYLLMEEIPKGLSYLTKALGVAEQAGLNGDAALWAQSSRRPCLSGALG